MRQQRQHPSGGACVPAPAAAPGVHFVGVDVRSHHVGLHAVGLRLLHAVGVVQRQQHFDRPVRTPRVSHAHQRQCQPARGVGVLRAVLPDSRRIGRDVARIEVRAVEGRREQLDDPQLLVHKLMPRGVHGRPAARRIQSGQHRPGLGDGVDAAAAGFVASKGAPIVRIGPQIPLAVPALGLHCGAHALVQRCEPCAIRGVRRNPGVIRRADRQKLAQPHALAPALRAHAVHSVVPVAASHLAQAVLAEIRRPTEGAHAVLVQAGAFGGRLHLGVNILPILRQLHLLQKGCAVLQHRLVPGDAHVLRRHVGQKQQIVRDARAHAGVGLVPPVQHVARGELPRRAVQQMPPHALRLLVDEGQHVLQLVAEAVGPARLVQPRASKDAGVAGLRLQKSVCQQVDARIRGFKLQFQLLRRRGCGPRCTQRPHPCVGCGHALRAAQHKAPAGFLAGAQPQRQLQNPAALAQLQRIQATGRHHVAAGIEVQLAAARARLQVVRHEVAHAAGSAGEACAEARPTAQHAAVHRVRAHQPVHEARKLPLPRPAAAVFNFHVKENLIPRAAQLQMEAQARRGGVEATHIRRVAHHEVRHGLISRQQTQKTPLPAIDQIEHPPPALAQHIVGKGRDAAAAAVAMPGEAAAPLGDDGSGALGGQHVAPGRGRHAVAAQADRVAVAVEAAVAVGAAQIVGHLDGCGRHGRVFLSFALLQRPQGIAQLAVALDADRRDAPQRLKGLLAHVLLFQQERAARTAPQAAEVACVDAILQRVPHRLLVIAAMVADQHQIRLHAHHAVEAVGADQRTHALHLVFVPHHCQQNRQIAGDSGAPQRSALRRGACFKAPVLSGAQLGIKEQCRCALQHAVQLRIHTREAQRRAGARLRKLHRTLRRSRERQVFHHRIPLLVLDAGQGEVHCLFLARLQFNRNTQRGAGIEHVAAGSAELARNAARLPQRARAPDEPIQLRLARGLLNSSDKVEQLRMRLPPLPAPAPERKNVGCDLFTLHKQVLKHRMGAHIPIRRQRHRHAAGRLQPSRRIAAILQSELLDQRTALRGDRDPQLRLHAVQPKQVARAARVELRLSTIEHGLRAGLHVPQVHVHALVAVQQVAGEAVQLHAVVPGEHRAARRGQRRGVATVEQVHVRKIAFGPSGAGKAPFAVLCDARQRRFRMTPAQPTRASLLLQQQLQRPRLGNLHEAPGEDVLLQCVAQRAEDHALVVRHVAADQPGLAVGARVQVVRGLVHAVAAAPAHFAHASEVVRRSPRRDAQRQRTRIGRDHVLHGAAVQRQLPEAEGAVLIVQLEVEGVVARLRHAPGPLAPLCKVHLRRHHRPTGRSGQRSLATAQQQLRHQVLKHRAAPGHERRAAVHRDCGPGQPPPVLHAHLSQHDGGVAQDAGLRGVEVVVGATQLAALHIHADAEQLTLLIVERGHVHVLCQRPQPRGETRSVARDLVGAQQQRARKVAAVHGGHVPWAQRREVVEIVPVVQLSVPLVQALQRAGGGGHAAQHLRAGNQLQRTGGDAGQQVQADVRGRRARGSARRRIHLHVVRRESGAVQGHVGLKEGPGLPRQLLQQRPLLRRERDGRVLLFPHQILRPTGAHQEQRAQRQHRRNPEGAQQARQQQNRGHPARRAQAAPIAGGSVGSGHPVHQVLVADRQAVQRAQHRVQHVLHLQRQHGEPQRGTTPALPAQRMQDRVKVGQRQPQQKGPRLVQPQGMNQQSQQRGRVQAAHQVAQQLHPVHGGDPPHFQQHRQQLPVAAHPAVLPAQRGGGIGGRAVVEAHVVYEARAAEDALDQVVAENFVVIQPTLGSLHEGAHVVDALAGEVAVAGHVLIEVGHGGRVAVHAAVACGQLHPGVLHRVRGHLHVRLEHGVAMFASRTVQRMQHRADQLLQGSRQVLGVRVQRDHVAVSPRRNLLRSTLLRSKGIFCLRAVQDQAVQRRQRAALAVLAHPALIHRTVAARAVQIEVLLPARDRVQARNALPRGAQDRPVVLHAGPVRVPEVAQQQVVDVVIRLQAAQRLHVLDHLLGARLAAEQHRQRHQRARRIRHMPQLQLQDVPGAHEARIAAADQMRRRNPGQQQRVGQ